MNALVIKADGTTALVDISDGIRPMQGAVGGYIEAIVQTDGWIMYANEDGRRLNLPLNGHASALVRSVCEQLGIPVPLGADQMVGDVLIVGSDGSPDNAPIPTEWETLFDAMGLWPEQ